MSLANGVLRDEALTATPDGFSVDVHLAWYRSLPLSCLERLTISIDSEQVDAALLTLKLNGKTFSLDDLADKVGEWWFVQDSLTVISATAAGVQKGRRSNVGVDLEMRIPYIIVGPNKALVQATSVTSELVAL